MPATNEQARALKGSLENNDQPDFVIRSGDYKWHVHSAVISAESTFFDKLCRNGFKESYQKEVDLPEDCPWIIARMLQFLYFGRFHYGHDATICDYKVRIAEHPVHSGACCSSSLEKFMQIGQSGRRHNELKDRDRQRSYTEIAALTYRIADKYDITKLRNLAVEQLMTLGIENEEHFFNIANTIGLSRLYMEDDLLSQMVYKIVDLEFMSNAEQFPRFNMLFRDEHRITQLVVKQMQKRYQEMKRDLEGKCKSLIQKHSQDLLIQRSRHGVAIDKLQQEVRTSKKRFVPKRITFGSFESSP